MIFSRFEKIQVRKKIEFSKVDLSMETKYVEGENALVLFGLRNCILMQLATPCAASCPTLAARIPLDAATLLEFCTKGNVHMLQV